MEHFRNCPICNISITYSTKYTLKYANNRNSLCKSCRGTSNFNTMHDKMKSGELKYGFSNRSHTSNTKNIISDNVKVAYAEGRLNVTGENNPMYGTHIPNKYKGITYDERFGKEKSKLIREKISKKNIGENNPMYGKPSPTGSGNGWSGWYKGWYFRSIYELSYMINIIERFKLEWKPAESKKYMVPYKYFDGRNRTYMADFIISNKYMVECKPRKRWNSKVVQLKKNAAVIFCNDNNLIYKMVECNRLSRNEIIDVYNSGDLIFTDRYDKKFKML